VKVGYIYMDGGYYPQSLDDYQPFFEWQERRDVFTDVAATRYITDLRGMTVKTGKGSVQLGVREVTTNFFDTLGVTFPGIQAWKEAANVKNPKTVVFTHKTGFGKFGYESMGKLFPAHEEGYSIIASGILPENFVLPGADDYGDECTFTPMELRPGDNNVITESRRLADRVLYSSHDPLTVYARLAPGVTPRLAEQMLAGTSGGAYTNANGDKMRLRIMPISDIITMPYRSSVRYAWAMCALLMVLCAANLGGILLTRCTYRLREYAVRSALGATLSNLVRTLLLELFGIAVIAALIAAAIAQNAMPLVADRVPVSLGAFGRPVFGLHTAAFLVIATAAIMLASAAPSISALVRNYYKGFSQGIFAVFLSHRTLRISLTAGQTAIATLLVCISWMTVRGYSDIFFRDTGVNTDVRVISVLYPSLKATGAAQDQSPPFDIYDTLNAFRGGDPNGRAAVFMAYSVFNRGQTLAEALAREKRMMEEPLSRELFHYYGENQTFSLFRVSPGFFQTLDVKIIAGRDFNDSDLHGRELIVNEALVRKMGWTPWDAVGRETHFPGSGNTTGTIIGVAEDFLTGSWDSEILPELYTPIIRGGVRPDVPVYYIVHPDVMPRVNVGNIEKTIRGFDPDATITRNASWSDILGATVRGSSFTTFCIALFTIAAIAIVVIGIASTITFIVARRMRDIAIQIALGAPSFRVCWFVMKDMVIAGIIGALAGVLASWWVGRAFAHFVYNGEKYQNLTGLAIATVIMLAIIAAASLLPALRALRIEPNRALNME